MGVEEKNAEKGIGQSLIALVLVAVVPLLLFGSGVAWTIIDQKKAAVAGELAGTARALQVAVDRELLSQFAVMDVLASDISLDSANPAAFQKRADQVLKANNEWLTVALMFAR